MTRRQKRIVLWGIAVAGLIVLLRGFLFSVYYVGKAEDLPSGVSPHSLLVVAKQDRTLKAGDLVVVRIATPEWSYRRERRMVARCVEVGAGGWARFAVYRSRGGEQQIFEAGTNAVIGSVVAVLRIPFV